MSNQRIHDSKLDTCQGPFFPDSVIRCHTVYASLSGYFERPAIVEAARGIRKFLHADNVEWSSDGYIGLATLTFAVSGGLVMLRLPRCNDFDWEDGTITDRCSALYTLGHVPAYEINRIADEMRKRISSFPILSANPGRIPAPEFLLWQ